MNVGMNHDLMSQTITIVIACFWITSPGTFASAQSSPKQPHEMDEAHVHTADMSCCRCAPTDADQDPDVFKRPCFIHALVRSRETVRAFVAGLTGRPEREGIHVAADGIPARDVGELQTLLAAVIMPGYLPRTWDAIEFSGRTPCIQRTVSETRNGVPTLVRQKLDCSAEVKEIKPGDLLLTGWTANRIEVLPLTWHEQERPLQTALLRFRLRGGDRLELKARPAEFRRAGIRADNFGDFFDKAAFHAFLTRILRVPFATSDDLMMDGSDATYEGVHVFHGRIVSREWGPTWQRSPEKQIAPNWWDEMRFLVTDSDPQYVCIQLKNPR
jgi:hypothetical protein